MEERKKRIVVGVTVAAVILLAFLLIFWIYQLIAIGSRNARIEELNAQIEQIEAENELLDKESEEYKNNMLWLEIAARELGMRR